MVAVAYTEYQDLHDAWEQIAHWLEYEYMTQRIHSALGYFDPAEFEAGMTLDESHSLLLTN